MIEKFEELKKEFLTIEKKLTLPEVINNPEKLKEHSRRHSELKEVVGEYEKFLKLTKELTQAEQLAEEERGEMHDMAMEETQVLSKKVQKSRERLREYLIPSDPDRGKDIIMEIRAAVGGDEAGLFCSDLYRMYSKYAENHGWNIDIYNASKTGLGGLKEIIFAIEGKDVYEKLKYESGVHRVQRVPQTETGGRIHTSACTVAVLPQAGEVEVSINEKDLRIDTYRASGSGGQHVNVTDSAVRITHIPTGTVVQCQDERSQHQNKRKALNMLRAKIKEQQKLQQQRSEENRRRNQVGTGDRSEKIRTYNFPQNRITDHRVNISVYNIDAVIEGELGELLQQVRKEINRRQIEEVEAGS